MGFRQKIKISFKLLLFFIETFPIRLYRPIKKLLFLIKNLWQVDNWRRQIWEDLFGITLLLGDILGIAELYEIVTMWMKVSTRGLTPKEKDICRSVMGVHFPTDLVKIDNRATVTAGSKKYAYVSFFTINVSGELPESTFVHELIHIWQYTRYGSEYISRAIFAQHSKEGYNYGGPAGLTQAYIENKSIEDFNFEQQGDILADYYVNERNAKKLTVGLYAQRNRIYGHFIKQIREKTMYRW